MKIKNQVLNWDLRAVNLRVQIPVESTKLCCASKGLFVPYKRKRRVAQIIYQEITNSSCPLCDWTDKLTAHHHSKKERRSTEVPNSGHHSKDGVPDVNFLSHLLCTLM